MQSYKTAKIYFCFAVLLLVAKPFLGFGMFSRVHPPAEENIFVKAFNKRKQEYSEDSNFNLDTIFKKLAEPAKQLFLRFSFFLNILFPAIFSAGFDISFRFLNEMQLGLSPRRHSFLLNNSFLI